MFWLPIAIAGFWLLLGIGMTALGLQAIRVCGGRPAGGMRSAVLGFWCGWAVLVALLQFWHLFLPIDRRACWAAAALMAAALAATRQWWYVLGSRQVDRRLLAAAAACGAAALVVAMRSRCVPMNPDTGLYHLQSVRWAQAYAIIPGLGNLHDVLAYNQSHFLYVAWVSSGPWGGEGYHVANGLLLMGAMAPLIASACRLGLPDPAAYWLRLLSSVLLLYLALQVLRPYISSPTPDLAVFTLEVVLVWLLAILAEPACPEHERRVLALAAMSLIGTGITAKLSIAGFALGILAALALLAARQRPRDEVRRFGLYCSLMLVLTAGCWLVRGLIISGYPFFPATFGQVDFDWTMPRGDVIEMTYWIRSWARVPGYHWSHVLDNWRWLGPWGAQLLHNVNFLGPLAILAAATASHLQLVARQRQPCTSAAPLGLTCWLPAMAGTAFWFWTAPDVRYNGACFWIMAAAGVAALPRRHSLTCVRACLALLACATAAALVAAVTVPRFSLPPGETGFQPAPEVTTREYRTRSGLMLYTPPDVCWDARLPCTPDPKPLLRLRRPGELQSGFTVR